MVNNVEIHGVSIILRVRYEGRVWNIFCYRSINYLTAQCLRGDVLHRSRLETAMIQCLNLLKSRLREGLESLQKIIIELYRIYFTRKQISYVKTIWKMG
jgi:hypothetical protein